MSNLSEIVKLKTKNLSEQNRKEAEIKCQEADNLIAEALASGGNDKNKVEQAILLYHESLGLYSYQVKPYIGLAYIMYSMDDLKSAIGLLNSAMNIEPLYPNLNKMLFIFKEEYKESKGGKNFHKSGKTLSEKLADTKTNNKPSFFDQITAIFSTSIKPKKGKKQTEDFGSLLKDTSAKMKINQTGTPGKVADNNKSNEK
jgi:hypothetical protein